MRVFHLAVAPALIVAVCVVETAHSFLINDHHHHRPLPQHSRFLTQATTRCNNGFKSPRKWGSLETTLRIQRGSGGVCLAATSSAVSIVLTGVGTFYQSFPVVSAMMTCGVKGCLADLISQFGENRGKRASQKSNFSFKRNSAYVLYSGFFLGIMCDLIYNRLYPIMFGPSHALSTILSKVVFDSTIVAPLCWLPPAYLVNAVVYGFSPMVGLKKYLHDIRHKSLLKKYSMLWVPVQLINFAFVPDCFRVAFVAVVGFFWLCILSSVQSSGAVSSSKQLPVQEDDEEEDDEDDEVCVLQDGFTCYNSWVQSDTVNSSTFWRRNGSSSIGRKIEVARYRYEEY
jgi:hypothetical protein